MIASSNVTEINPLNTFHAPRGKLALSDGVAQKEIAADNYCTVRYFIKAFTMDGSTVRRRL
jgi:hypothetical protein